MPVHNAEAFVGEAIESILAQTFADFEFIIVDDCSTDGSLRVIRSYDDPRIVLLRNETNLGVARSLNRGLEMARGEYLARMDADDRCAPERLEKQVAYLQAHPELAAVGTWARLIDAEGRATGKEYLTPCEPAEIRREAIRRIGIPAHATAMIRTAALRRLGGYRPWRYVEDYDLWLRLTDQEACVAAIPEYLYEIRRHENQETRRDWSAACVCIFLVREAALRRRAGRRDPLEGLDYDGFMALVEAVRRGKGYWGRRWRAQQHWGRASELWDRGDHRGAAREMLKILRYCPTYGPMWGRIGETVARRCGYCTRAAQE